MVQEFKDNKAMFICFLGSFILKAGDLIAQSALSLWIISNSNSNIIDNNSNINIQKAALAALTSLFGAFIIVKITLSYPIGELIDKTSCHLQIIVTFVITGIAMMTLSTLTDVESYSTFLCITILLLGKYVGNMVLDTMFAKYLR